ncbi:hypothetical protein BU24DRAFT_424366 [Aaosphaeria arxii CBS 175.79]|uniref:Secreted protein n=1 Tax=Aaosphaeria arxii CBS 175.79 TaxID=1450172 RepID=A0A6A5XJQ8_9PLEO|nr:uncharacterized protein BU24DRAFT_424366 [Aaosphaeria arxii CBS 175.79]KAF2013362.1 hypothetical protein BU24DRAFT_424366 [Aaosphaeria arxii CBS 175.79]
MYLSLGSLHCLGWALLWLASPDIACIWPLQQAFDGRCRGDQEDDWASCKSEAKMGVSASVATRSESERGKKAGTPCFSDRQFVG